MIKKSMLLFVFPLCFLALSIQSYRPSEKIYINIEDITFDDNVIVLHTESNGICLCTRANYADSQGFYALSDEEFWICPKCKTRNPGRFRREKCCNPNCDWPLRK